MSGLKNMFESEQEQERLYKSSPTAPLEFLLYYVNFINSDQEYLLNTSLCKQPNFTFKTQTILALFLEGLMKNMQRKLIFQQFLQVSDFQIVAYNTQKEMQRILEKKQIEELKYRNRLILLHFVTEWCNPCKFSRKLLQTQLSKKSNEYVIAEINCDEAEQLVLDYQIEGVPTFVVLDKNLNPVKRLMGYLPEKIKNLFKREGEQ